MPLVSDRWEAFKEGIKEKRYVLGSIFAVVVGASDWIQAWLRGRGMTGETFGVPSWTIGVIVAVALVAWWLLEYAVQLRRQLAPKVSLEFGGVVTTPLKKRTRTLHQADGTVTETTEEFKGVYIRGLVRATSKTAAINCVPYLVGIRKKNHETGAFENVPYVEDIQLPWNDGGLAAITVPNGVRRYFNILDATERRQRLDPAGPWPLTLRRLFDEKTTYQLDLLVAGSSISERMTVEFTWTGDIFDIKGLQVATR